MWCKELPHLLQVQIANWRRDGNTDVHCTHSREVPWNPRSSEHNSLVEDSFHKEVLAAAEADARAEEEANQILQTRCVDELMAKQKSDQIYACLASMESQMKQEAKANNSLDLVQSNPKSISSQQWHSEQPLNSALDAECVRGDKELTELIIEDMKLYNTIVES